MFGIAKRQPEPQRERIEPRIGNMADITEVLSSDSSQVISLLSAPATDAGAIVTPGTSMRVATVYACVRLIAGAIASMPVDVYKRDADGRSTRVINDPIWWMLNEEACEQFPATAFKEFLIAQMLLYGDGFAYIMRNNNGRVLGLLPLRREQVIVQRVAPATPRHPVKIRYYVNTPDGAFTADAIDMLHLPGLGFNGFTSMSVIQWGARNATGIAMRADEFAGKFYSQGAQPQFAIKAPGAMGEKQQEELRAAWAAKYQGNGPNGIPLVLTEGLDISQLTMTAADAQLLESRKWQVNDIARAFGVPAHMIGDTEKATTWGTGVEQMGQAFVDYTLGSHIKRFEDEHNRKLYQRGPKYIRVNVDGLMRGDATARANYYKSALGGTQNPAWMTPNEVRERENLPPIDNGDDLSQPQPASTPPPTGDTGNAANPQPAGA